MSNRLTCNTYQEATERYEIACPSCGGHEIEYHRKVTTMAETAIGAVWTTDDNGKQSHTTLTPIITVEEQFGSELHWQKGRFVCPDCGRWSTDQYVFIRPVRR